MDDLSARLALEAGALHEIRLVLFAQAHAHRRALGEWVSRLLRLAMGHVRGYPGSRHGDRLTTASTCLTTKRIAQRTRNVKSQAMPRPDKQLTEPYVRWIEAEMAKLEWSQAELARQANMKEQSVISRMLSREVAPDMATLQKLAKALGKPLPEMGPISEGRARPGEGIPRRDSTRSAKVRDATSSARPESLGAEQIADEVGAVLEPLVLQLAAKGESVVARWLPAVAGEANDQSVDNVRPLIDLAREFLWRVEKVE